MTAYWYQPTDDGTCPECAEKVVECEGICLYPGTYYEPPEYGCLSEEKHIKGVNTAILAHEQSDGEQCAVGADNNGEQGMCKACHTATWIEEDVP